MQNFPGVGVSPGRVIGTIRQMPKPISEPPAGEQLAPDTTAEEATAALKAASQAVHDELKERAAHAIGDGKAVLEATALMAKDTMLIKGAAKLVARGVSAERAIWESGSSVSEMLHNLGGYMAERATDVLDVRARIVAALRGVPAPGIPASNTPFVLVAEDLAPADTATLDPNKVLALVTAGGGPQSHTAIIARSLGLPAVVAAVGVDELPDGTEVYVDGAAGSITAEPDETLRATAEAWAATASLLAEFTGTGTTADGHQVPLLANVGGGKDAEAAAKLGAQGVGLFRTEFCFLERDTEPSVEEQAAAYKSVFDAFPGKKVVLRTLDAGADKPLPFLTDSTEPNPALGVRGYRTDFTTPGVLDRQLEAIALAQQQSQADVWVMAPMISTAEEASRFASMCADAGIKTPGVMVEVPSAALTAEAILREVSFASLGTNDLTQYAMAADRQLGPLANLNTPWQPAVLRLVGLTVEGSRAEGHDKPVGVCGEAAADPALAVVLTGLGVSTLSMTARSLAAVAAVLKTVTLSEAQELAKLALSAPSATEARAWVREKLPVLEELGL
ncbi:MULTISPECIES: phosphoenolpyruvate--protein phosphotransferase [Micrococcaceae]|uniref:Phosphoenolpyruvate-protein phosphotransferase n=1 Tax=Pseudarthrobacter defluvii TaxID=410837 RepID=A0ABT9UKC3_9MICC|nr:MULTISPECIES: phosphoenolpyruvate--protein phosphotransferase [Micrococcaceae]MDE8588916.1 phosphoenolpyruvate--protein phosphotransferase [Arthrobacter sp. NQ4]MDQ0119408.1 phosphotransferase system enzyme I (PtsI) [Pseudarthrobacter defluvii]BCW80607.1 phosphoenolpyruvate-protein phosphotransferase [Arthrobacter sp. NicSoilC5]VXB01732.1 Phosphoenolpyruvate-protein phosphotransferase [Arthrobacter sp. 8AJ]